MHICTQTTHDKKMDFPAAWTMHNTKELQSLKNWNKLTDIINLTRFNICCLMKYYKFKKNIHIFDFFILIFWFSKLFSESWMLILKAFSNVRSFRRDEDYQNTSSRAFISDSCALSWNLCRCWIRYCSKVSKEVWLHIQRDPENRRHSIPLSW